jgi:archaeal flagellar protein FlaJ
MEKIIFQAGFKSVEEFFIKVVAPIVFATLISFFMLLIFTRGVIPFWASYIVLILGLSVIFAVPYLKVEKTKVNIHENIHLFITYIGTVSTIDLDRITFFKKIAENQDYGEISKVFSKVVFLAKEWNLGFAYTLRKIARSSPSRLFADFLDRFAAAMDFGEDMDVFLVEEQNSVLDDYSTEYRKSLNNIAMLREAFIAITISVAFGMSTALLLPLLMGVSIVVAVQWCLFALVLIDVFLLILIREFIPKDELCHDLKIKSKGIMKVYYSFIIIAPISAILLLGLLLFNILPFLFVVSIASLPLIIVGFFAVKEEERIFKRDKEFPAFIRSLGSTIDARQGGILSSIEALQVHDFGTLQDNVVSLYKRLKIGSDKTKSWLYFAGETGSMLISRFIHIFSQAVYLGGAAHKIGIIISENFQKILALRKLKQQQASALKGSLYGSMVGFIATVYISVSISTLLTDMFSSAWDEETSSGMMSSMVSSIVPSMPAVDLELVNIYIAIIVIFHAFISSLIIKFVDGGNKFAMFFDFNAMLWIGAILSWIIPKFTMNLFGGAMGAA